MVDFDDYRGGIYGFISIVIVMTIFVLLFGSVIIYLIVGLIDSFTSEQVDTESVKCIDERGREFEDELCEKEIHCSWLGVAGDIKCKDWRAS